MKVKEDFVLREVAGAFVVVPSGDLTLDFNGIIHLNETGAFLFDRLRHGAERGELISAMLDEYQVDEARAEADIDAFIKKLKDADILE